jgi:hypothetical protein
VEGVAVKGKKTGGRRKGTPNKVTASIKAAFSDAFDKLGGVPSLVQWGRENQTEFYKLVSKLIPSEVSMSGEMTPLVIDLVTAADVQAKRDGDADA